MGRVQNASIPSRRVSSLVVPGDTSIELLNELQIKTAAHVNKTGFKAPERIFQAVKASADLPFEKGRAHEQQLFEELASGPQAPAMQYAFFAERIATSPPKLSKDAVVPTINTVGIVGGGTMVSCFG